MPPSRRTALDLLAELVDGGRRAGEVLEELTDRAVETKERLKADPRPLVDVGETVAGIAVKAGAEAVRRRIARKLTGG